MEVTAEAVQTALLRYRTHVCSPPIKAIQDGNEVWVLMIEEDGDRMTRVMTQRSFGSDTPEWDYAVDIRFGVWYEDET